MATATATATPPRLNPSSSTPAPLLPVTGAATGNASSTPSSMAPPPSATTPTQHTPSTSNTPTTANGIQHSRYSRMHSIIEHPNCPLTFIITDCPSDQTMSAYLSFLEEHSVRDLVRVCESKHYDAGPLRRAGINVVDELNFEDGSIPPKSTIASYRQLLDSILARKPLSVPPDSCQSMTKLASGAATPNKPTIAIHCVSGVGRAPVMVAIALIDFAGLDAMEAVEFIRQKRRGSFNKNQLTWLLDDFKRRKGGGMGGFMSRTWGKSAGSPAKMSPTTSGAATPTKAASVTSSSTLSSISQEPRKKPSIKSFFKRS
ncbi:Protein tyrosine phosphatase type IVA 1 [Quaeritorhiza haematococci]|nr:Protein tyrosine phosphatase type IVA 1 [Quaeritorhiza haematococci]